jgi:putative ABC transport system substrate-binding protein
MPVISCDIRRGFNLEEGYEATRFDRPYCRQRADAAPACLRTRTGPHLPPRQSGFRAKRRTASCGFLAEVGRLRFIVGKNLKVDGRGYGLRPEQFAEHATELVNAQVDVISAGGDAAVRAAQRATSTIPILAVTDDMLGQGFVRSLAKPGGNITGVSIVAGELDAKRQEILIEALPAASHLAALVDTNITAPLRLTELTNAAREHGVELSIYQVTVIEDIVPAINAAKASGAGAVNVLASSLFFKIAR